MKFARSRSRDDLADLCRYLRSTFKGLIPQESVCYYKHGREKNRDVMLRKGYAARAISRRATEIKHRRISILSPRTSSQTKNTKKERSVKKRNSDRTRLSIQVHIARLSNGKRDGIINRNKHVGGVTPVVYKCSKGKTLSKKSARKTRHRLKHTKKKTTNPCKSRQSEKVTDAVDAYSDKPVKLPRAAPEHSDIDDTTDTDDALSDGDMLDKDVNDRNRVDASRPDNLNPLIQNLPQNEESLTSSTSLNYDYKSSSESDSYRCLTAMGELPPKEDGLKYSTSLNSDYKYSTDSSSDKRLTTLGEFQPMEDSLKSPTSAESDDKYSPDTDWGKYCSSNSSSDAELGPTTNVFIIQDDSSNAEIDDVENNNGIGEWNGYNDMSAVYVRYMRDESLCVVRGDDVSDLTSCDEDDTVEYIDIPVASSDNDDAGVQRERKIYVNSPPRAIPIRNNSRHKVNTPKKETGKKVLLRKLAKRIKSSTSEMRGQPKTKTVPKFDRCKSASICTKQTRQKMGNHSSATQYRRKVEKQRPITWDENDDDKTPIECPVLTDVEIRKHAIGIEEELSDESAESLYDVRSDVSDRVASSSSPRSRRNEDTLYGGSDSGSKTTLTSEYCGRGRSRGPSPSSDSDRPVRGIPRAQPFLSPTKPEWKAGSTPKQTLSKCRSARTSDMKPNEVKKKVSSKLFRCGSANLNQVDLSNVQPRFMMYAIPVSTCPKSENALLKFLSDKSSNTGYTVQREKIVQKRPKTTMSKPRSAPQLVNKSRGSGIKADKKKMCVLEPRESTKKKPMQQSSIRNETQTTSGHVRRRQQLTRVTSSNKTKPNIRQDKPISFQDRLVSQGVHTEMPSEQGKHIGPCRQTRRYKSEFGDQERGTKQYKQMGTSAEKIGKRGGHFNAMRTEGCCGHT